MRLLLISALILKVLFSQAQDTTRMALPDSAQSQIIRYTPYYSQELRASGNYMKTIDDTALLRLSSGVSIFNALRGQVPGLHIPAYVAYANYTGMRKSPLEPVRDAVLIIDGVPFNNAIGSYMNLNAFEFSSISAISNANAVSFLGGANSGAFVLNSKTGEGIEKPLFEFNSSLTRGWEEVNDLQTGKMRDVNEWYLANTIAYSQDFGMVDTRISYNFLAAPSDLLDYTPLYHYLKINTGIAISPKLDARLMVDGRYNQSENFINRDGLPPANENRKVREDFLQGNVMLRYQVADWFAVTSQLVYATRDSVLNRAIEQQGSLDLEIRGTRQQANIFLNVNKSIGLNLALSGFFGVQYVKQSRHRLYSSTDQNGATLKNEMEWEQQQPHVAAGVTIAYKNFLTVSAQGRVAEYSLLHDRDDRKANYSIASSFIFTQLWKPRWMSFGKLRTGIGSHHHIPISTYPIEHIGFSNLAESTIRNVEVGGDFGFLESRASLSLNYFTNSQLYISGRKHHSRGWEAEVRYKLISQDALSLESGLLLATNKIKFDYSGIMDTSPNWRGGFVNQLKWKKILMTCLIESFHNDMALGESSYIKLRDISVAYTVRSPFFERVGVKNTVISVSGRNLIKLQGSGVDIEKTIMHLPLQKSISMNLYIAF